MNAFQKSLEAKTEGGRKLLVPYMTAGLPTPSAFVDLVRACGHIADAIEVGIPFSDPIMDGPVIQRSSTAALDAGVTVASAMKMIAEVKQDTDISVAVMTYFNPIHKIGIGTFVDLAATSGVGALIVPDLPYDESGELGAALHDAGLDLVQMVAPTTSRERAATLASAASGFVYAVSRMGVTGEQTSLTQVAEEVVARVRQHASAPVLVGIGISTPDQAYEASRFADGVIVGSALVSRVLDGQVEDAIVLLKQIREGIDRP